MKKFFSLLWRGWKKFAHVLGIVNTKILLTIAYFIVMGIVSIITKIFGRDLIDRRMKPQPTFYHTREPLEESLETVKRQF